MFEILKALRDLNTACMANGSRMTWQIERLDTDGIPVLRAEIGLSEADVEFVEQMQAMFAPKEA